MNMVGRWRGEEVGVEIEFLVDLTLSQDALHDIPRSRNEAGCWRPTLGEVDSI